MNENIKRIYEELLALTKRINNIEAKQHAKRITNLELDVRVLERDLKELKK